MIIIAGDMDANVDISHTHGDMIAAHARYTVLEAIANNRSG